MIVLFLRIDHDLYDLGVGGLHTHSADMTDAADRIACILLQNAGAGGICLAFHRKGVGEERRIECRGDLNGAGCFGTVANDTGNIGKGVVDGVFDLRERTTDHIGNSSTCGAGGGDGSAKCRKLADVFFLENRQKGRENK